MFDYYHHLEPSTKIGNLIVTGGWDDNVGRYGLDDFPHANGFDPVVGLLEKEFAIIIHKAPFTKEALAQTDAVVIANPDSPVLAPRVPLRRDEEIQNLENFVHNGGSLMVIINSGGHDSEKFEEVQLRKLVRRFGLDWNSDNTHYSDIQIGNLHPYFHDVPIFHYGAGCTIAILPDAPNPTVLMEVYSDPTYLKRNVRGPGIVMTQPGLGKVIIVGDTGSFGGNFSRPWADNPRIATQLFRYMKPSTGVSPKLYKTGQAATYDFTVAGMTVGPNDTAIADIVLPHHRLFQPKKYTGGPYLEAYGSLTLTCRELTTTGVAKIDGKLNSFRFFDRDQPLEDGRTIEMTVSRQGKLATVSARGDRARWISADIGALVALLPVDGLRIGDRWESVEELRIPTIMGSDAPVTKPVEVEINYVRDEEVDGRACRMLRVSAEFWIDDIGITIEDVLPVEEIRKWGGPDSAFYESGRKGGSFLVKREQWVDIKTGHVIKARTQSRIAAWIHDLRQPVGASPDDKDKSMVTVFSHDVTFRLRN